jgi:integrase
MGQKNSKGSVSIVNDNTRIRLRWRYQTKRYSLNLFHFSKPNLLQARKTALQIEQDMAVSQFDFSLQKYSGKDKPSPSTGKSIVKYFEEWTTSYKQMDCEKHCNYNQVRNMISKWGLVSQSTILAKFNSTTLGERTYNRRLTMLKEFCKWLVKRGVWVENPLEDVNRKRSKKVVRTERLPFTEEDIKRILDAFKTDKFAPKFSASKHSQFYPFVYFIFKTGVRNSEAIGLRVKSINFEKKVILINEVLARSLKGTNAAARVRKETKNGKERYLPLTDDLKKILEPLTKGKSQDDLMFKSYTGLAIDDHMFQKRIFKKVLKELKIEERVLYACRHTFGSRCIDQGVTPVMTAFLMGNNPETALRNYTHLINLPTTLPNI